MQLYALFQNQPTLASHAIRGRDYICPECRRVVRLRGGFSRQRHFYHLKTQASCRQHLKSISHLQLQLHLKSLIPTISLEKPFPSIARIADAAWDEAKIIFEVQCSPISLEEAQKRTADYQSLGWRVVWLLHDQRYNKRNLSPVELHLRSAGAYYFSRLHIYDQFDIIHQTRRLHRGPKLSVTVREPLPVPVISHPPMALKIRNWKLSFRGDLFDRLSRAENTRAFRRQERLIRRRRWLRRLARGYLTILHALLAVYATKK
ncbi:MAG: hypothetical protein JSR58_01440 [Verrucomicrobia bacterium]|nr:hypothetical protein [Verrucomicrobiota bacterium]